MQRNLALAVLLIAAIPAACGEEPGLPVAEYPARPSDPTAAPPTEPLVVPLERIDASLRALASEDAAARRRAETELVSAGPGAAPRLLELCSKGNPQVLAAAPNLFRAMGPDVVPHLRHALTSGDADQRVVAVMALLLLGRDAAGAADALAAARADPDPRVRAAAEHAYKRATSDTSDLDRQRVELDEALRRSRDH